jgi:hypothetical protein
VFTFSGSEDQVISIRTTKVKTGSTLRLREADEDQDLDTLWSPQPSGGLLVTKLPSTGQYVIVVDPQQDSLESGTIALYDVTERPKSAAVIGGGSATVRTSAPGQVGIITFTATAGQLVSVRSRGDDGYFATITAPNGDVVRDRQWLPGNFTVNDLVLQQSGQYEVLVESPDGSPRSFTLELTPR